jgi:hypothetical protein
VQNSEELKLPNKALAMTTRETSQDDDGSAMILRKLSTSETTVKGPGQQRRVSAWDDRLSELADYRKIHKTAMFLKSGKTSWLNGSQTKGPNICA